MGTIGRQTTTADTGSSPGEFPFSPELRRALLPWIDLAALDSEAFESWLLTVLPLLPRSGAAASSEGEDRLRTLSLALVQAAQERAVSHFRSAEYFRDNQMLVRRVKALEGILRLAKKRGFGTDSDNVDSAVDRASGRYLPRKRESG